MALHPRLTRSFVFVTGKGGVGKTTVATVLARALVAEGRRVLLCFTDAASGAHLLGLRSLGASPREVQSGLWAVLIEPESALIEYGGIKLHSKTASKALFENRVAKSFLAAIPGLYQWAVLGKACYHAQERHAGVARFDSVVLDAPATGHGLEMLRVPRVITEAAAAGPLRRDAEAAWEMLSDPTRTTVALVTLPEELPVQEALDLDRELAALQLPAPVMIVNNVSPAVFSSIDRERLAAARVAAQMPESRAVLDVALEQATLESGQGSQLERLRVFCVTAKPEARPHLELPRVENAESSVGLQLLQNVLSSAL